MSVEDKLHNIVYNLSIEEIYSFTINRIKKSCIPKNILYNYNVDEKLEDVIIHFCELKSKLLFLCQKQIKNKEKWDIHIPFLIRRTNNKFPNFAECIISELKKKDMLIPMKQQFEDNEWSRKWLN